MARKKIVAGNWKMHLTLNEASDLVQHIRDGMKGTDGVEKIIFPPFPFIKTMNDLLIDEPDLSVGAQNCSAHPRGAFTGEVSASMLQSVGCRYVIIGHSERRQYFAENSGQLTMKIAEALNCGLRVIYCIGETLDERKSDRHFTVIRQQVHEVLENYPSQKLSDLLLAYEPVWAIGTGVTATAAQAQEMHAYVRKELSAIFGKDHAAQIPILYGGSCNAQNAKSLFAEADVDGGLIGGASLKAADFCTIARSFR